MKHLLTLGALTPPEMLHILDIADEYKRLHKAGADPKDLQGKTVALLFAQHSTRTRASLEAGIYHLGGLGAYLSARDLQAARGEPLRDTARVLGRYYDAIVCRTCKQADLELLAQVSGVPVVSGMTDYAHPLQALADLMTVRAYKGRLAGLRAGFIGDGCNVCNSLIAGCLAMGMTLTVACPPDYRPAAGLAVAETRDMYVRDTLRYPLKLKPGEHVSLNAADTSLLKRVPGIGSGFARAIVGYRERLGGYYSVSQLLEISGFPQSALPYFDIGTARCRRLNVNTATLSQLRRHPYIGFYRAKTIVDHRRLHGIIRSLSELGLYKDFTPEAVDRLSHYVEF